MNGLTGHVCSKDGVGYGDNFESPVSPVTETLGWRDSGFSRRQGTGVSRPSLKATFSFRKEKYLMCWVRSVW